MSTLRLPGQVYGLALHAGGGLLARELDGSTQPLDVPRWLADVDQVDARLLASVRGPVLDVGCGPGRHVQALAQRGVHAMGIDSSPHALKIATQRGAEVVLGDIFTEQLEVSAWETVLLLDGNLGIGGSPERLLLRISELLRPTGQLIVEVSAPGTGLRRGPVRLEHHRLVSTWFPWARVDPDHLEALAPAARLRVDDVWQDEQRWFARLSPSEPGAACR